MAYIQSFGRGTSGVVKATAGRVLAVHLTNTSAETRYFQLFDHPQVPAPGAVPVFCYPVSAQESIALGADLLGSEGIEFTPGCTWGISTLKDEFFPATASEHMLFVRYQ